MCFLSPGFFFNNFLPSCQWTKIDHARLKKNAVIKISLCKLGARTTLEKRITRGSWRDESETLYDDESRDSEIQMGYARDSRCVLNKPHCADTP